MIESNNVITGFHVVQTGKMYTAESTKHLMIKKPLKIDQLSGTRGLVRYNAIIKITHQ